MKQVFLSRKGIELKEVPEPLVEKGKVLVKNIYSCVSPGTEISSLNSIKKKYIEKNNRKTSSLKKFNQCFKKKGY